MFKLIYLYLLIFVKKLHFYKPTYNPNVTFPKKSWLTYHGVLQVFKKIFKMKKFLKKLKTELPYDPAIPLLGIYLEENMVWKATCTSMLAHHSTT